MDRKLRKFINLLVLIFCASALVYGQVMQQAIVNSAVLSTPIVTGQSLGSTRNNSSLCLGFEFTAPSSNPPTVTALGRWVVSGNSGSHTLYLGKYVGTTWTTVATVSVNTSGATAATYLYGSVTPVTLLTSTNYGLFSCELNTGDSFYDAVGTTVTINSAFGASETGAYEANPPTSGNLTQAGGAGHSYGPVNFLAYQ
jgi:hypothetical protein